MKKLSERERRFCEEYLIDFAPVKAMRRAGYSEASANKCSGAMMQRPHVAAFLAEKARKKSEKCELSAERVLEEFKRLALANTPDFYKVVNGKIVPKALDELTREQQSAISEIGKDGSFKFYNKDNALDKLAKHFKLYTDLEAGVTQFVVMPTLKIAGKEVVFEVGKPAPDPLATKS